MRKFRPLQEPIRLQDLLNSANSRAEKRINHVILRVKISCLRAKAHLVFHWCLYNKRLYQVGVIGKHSRHSIPQAVREIVNIHIHPKKQGTQDAALRYATSIAGS